jgi:hypothetical protein
MRDNPILILPFLPQPPYGSSHPITVFFSIMREREREREREGRCFQLKI